MAQETAGTIGIPVLRNEILPYISDFKRRQDRYAALEAQRAAKLADLEYKKQQERNKASISALPGIAGNYYSDILRDMQNKDLSDMTQMAGNPNVPNADLYQMGAITKTENETRNNFATQRSKEIDDMKKQAETYGVSVNPGLIGSHLATRYQSSPIRNSQFFQESDSEQILDQALGDINNVNFARLGQTMIGKSKPKSERIETPDRKTTEFQYYDVFIPKRVKGTVATGDAFMAGPVDINRADQIFEGEPIAKKIRDRAVEQMVTANQKDPAFAALTVEEQNKEAKQAFYDQVFANYKGQTQYVRSLEQGRAAAAGRGKEEKVPTITETPVSPVINQIYTDKATNTTTKVDGTLRVKSGYTYTFPKPIPVASNKKVFVLGGNVEEAVKAGILQSFGAQPGIYTLNTGFNLKKYTEIPRLYRLTKDTELTKRVMKRDGTMATIKGMVPRGTWLYPDQVVALTKEGKSDNFEIIKDAIRFTPQTYQAALDDDDTQTGYKGPKLENLDLVILKNEFDEIAPVKQKEPKRQRFSAFK